LDQGSEHPPAAAIVAAARDRKLAIGSPENLDTSSGIGVQGQVAGKRLVLGNTVLMQQLRIAVEALKLQAETLRTEGASVLYLAVDGTLAGLLVDAANTTLLIPAQNMASLHMAQGSPLS
jgi:Cu+-exporting ATPase